MRPVEINPAPEKPANPGAVPLENLQPEPETAIRRMDTAKHTGMNSATVRTTL